MHYTSARTCVPGADGASVLYCTAQRRDGPVATLLTTEVRVPGSIPRLATFVTFCVTTILVEFHQKKKKLRLQPVLFLCSFCVTLWDYEVPCLIPSQRFKLSTFSVTILRYKVHLFKYVFSSLFLRKNGENLIKTAHTSSYRPALQ